MRGAGNKIATFLAVLYIEVVRSCSITGRRNRMATYSIEPARDTLHGTFSREYPPILTIDSGDSVLFRTLNAGWVLEPPSFKNANVKKFEPRIKGRDDGHALCGPIAIRGAEPGMTLEIHINGVLGVHAILPHEAIR